jgi:hypothetical protein
MVPPGALSRLEYKLPLDAGRNGTSNLLTVIQFLPGVTDCATVPTTGTRGEQSDVGSE